MSITWSELYSKIFSQARVDRQLFYSTFELTSRCNFRCKMCYICGPANEQDIKNRELTAQQWLQLGKEARDAGVLYLTLTGGEVFLRQDFKEIYEGLINMGFVIQIFTNGSLITPEIIAWLKKMPPSMISITLYGISPETYQVVTGHADGYERTVKAIDMLREAGISVEIKTTPIKANMDEYNELVEFVKKRGTHLGVVNYISPRREGDLTDPLVNRLTPEQLSVYEKNVIETNRIFVKENLNIKVSVEDSMTVEKRPEELKTFKPDPNDAFNCGAGKCGNWIAWDGRMLPCGTMDKPETYPLGTGFSAAWEELKKICVEIPVSNECIDCKYRANCDTCPGRLYTETGSFNKSAKYLCDNAKLRYEAVMNEINK